MNVELLQKVKAHILEEPKRLNMRHYFVNYGTNYPANEIPPCGTTGCIAGWACVLSGLKSPSGNFWGKETAVEAAKLLGLPLNIWDPKSTPAARLFWTDRWPKEFEAAYNLAYYALDFKKAAEVTAQRIDHFIATRE